MLATLASMNSANRMKSVLKTKYSLETKVIQTPSSIAKEGCGYSIRFPDNQKDKLVNTAKELRINIRAFFAEKTENSKTVYIKE